MKIRNDFVTNSSSSSYIISRKKSLEFDEETLKKYPMLARFYNIVDMLLFASSDYTETGKGREIKNQMELDCYFADVYMYTKEELDAITDEDHWAKKIYSRALQLLNEGKAVIFKNIDHSDDILRDIIREVSKMDVGIEILESDDD